MQSRFYALRKGKEERVTFGTFHGIYYGILKWAYNLTSENILSEEEKYLLLQRIVEHMEIDIDDEKDFLQGISTEIGNVKNNRIPLEEYHAMNCEEALFAEIYQTYETERKRMRKMDFDDMLVQTYELFQKRKDILSQWQRKFRYILVDEFQDVNPVQYDVIRMLALPENNLFIVGDDDQSIYRFRGAKPEIMLNFPKDYPDAKKILLDVNYRSTKTIVNVSARLIEKNKARYKKAIVTQNGQGVNVHVQEVKHPMEESRYVIKEIQKAIKSGISPEEIAVLYRTHQDARSVVEACMEYGMTFQMKEYMPNLYDHFVAQNFITYVKMALGDRSRKSFLAIMNRPNRFLTRESMEGETISFEYLRKFYEDKEWMQDRIDQFELDLRMIKTCAPYAAIQYIRKRIGYDEFLRAYAKKRRMSVEEVFDVVAEIEERAKAYKTQEEWLAYIEEYSKNIKMQAQQMEKNRNGITLMTMHGAKGLEYDQVYVISANEGITPYKKAETEEEIEEERRLFYVAMTRAKKKLVISYCKARNGKDMERSRFVEELMK
jgi:DNA helicase-2/ATP-dependent DNA helicase PcrA